MIQKKKNALCIVISGPSGVGKDTLIERLAALGYRYAVTATTRKPRIGELDGTNHFFVSNIEFDKMVQKGELLEWAMVYGNHYGVPKSQIREAQIEGQHIIVRVDVQGARRIRQVIPDALQIFIAPPSLEVLRLRLKSRGVNSTEDMQLRLEAAKNEIQQRRQFDYVVVNKEKQINETIAALLSIISKEETRHPPRSFNI